MWRKYWRNDPFYRRKYLKKIQQKQINFTEILHQFDGRKICHLCRPKNTRICGKNKLFSHCFIYILMHWKIYIFLTGGCRSNLVEKSHFYHLSAEGTFAWKGSFLPHVLHIFPWRKRNPCPLTSSRPSSACCAKSSSTQPEQCSAPAQDSLDPIM